MGVDLHQQVAHAHLLEAQEALAVHAQLGLLHLELVRVGGLDHVHAHHDRVVPAEHTHERVKERGREGTVAREQR